jgi:hypothetical protein
MIAPQRSSRRGSLTMELLLVLPVVVALLLGMIEFSMILFSRQQLLAASREGARVAALGGDKQDVKNAVRRYLGQGRLATTEVRLTDAAGDAIASGGAVPPGEAVEVWLRLPTNYAVPDLLKFVGFSIKRDELVARTVMRRE